MKKEKEWKVSHAVRQPTADAQALSYAHLTASPSTGLLISLFSFSFKSGLNIIDHFVTAFRWARLRKKREEKKLGKVGPKVTGGKSQSDHSFGMPSAWPTFR